jgi:hypothetical protein
LNENKRASSDVDPFFIFSRSLNLQGNAVRYLQKNNTEDFIMLVVSLAPENQTTADLLCAELGTQFSKPSNHVHEGSTLAACRFLHVDFLITLCELFEQLKESQVLLESPPLPNLVRCVFFYQNEVSVHVIHTKPTS